MDISKSRLTVLLLAVLFATTNCKKESVKESGMACGVTDPVNNLKWLNDHFKGFVGGPETNAIVLYNYNGNEVIEVQSSIFSSTNQHQYLCSGQRINFDDAIAFRDYRDKRTEVQVLYGTKIW